MAGKRIRKKQTSDWERCLLCGQILPKDPEQRVAGATGRAVCSDCLAVGQTIRSIPTPESQPPKAAPPPILPPGEVMTQLDRAIVGQEEAKRAVVMALWKQSLRANGEEIPNASLLLCGPTGCGKTALVRETARIMGLPFVSFDATSLSETGYRGRDAADMVRELVRRCGPDKAAHGVIFLDEFDKLAARKDNEYRAAYCRGTQYSLLKLIEGAEVDVDGDTIATGGILFLFGGAFTGLIGQRVYTQKTRAIGFDREEPEEVQEEPSLEPEDFISFGMEAELMGRVGRCIRLYALTEEQLRKILLESELSVLGSYRSFFRGKGRELIMEEEMVAALVRKALERGMGARGLNALVEEWVQPRLAQLAEELYEPTG